MKRIIALVMCIQFIFIYSLTASAVSAGAIKIDGKNNNNEWRGYNPLMMFDSSDPGNNVDAASIQFAFVSENNLKVFIAAQLKPKPESYDRAGFKVSFDGSDYIPVTIGDGTEKKYEIINDDDLRIEGATSCDISGMVFCELDVTIKGGAEETLECAFRVIDGEGVSSTEAEYSFVNPFFSTTAPVEQTTAEKTAEQAAAEEKTTKTTTEKTTKEKTTKTTTEKTTKEKTTKTTTEKTTKEKTTKVTTEKTTKEKTTKTTTVKTTKEKTTKTTTEKTTKEKTTKATTEKTTKAKKTEADGISTFAVTEHSRRTAGTAREKETAKTKAEKTSSAKKSTTKKEPEKVYVFEREVIVSETSASQPAQTVTLEKTVFFSEQAVTDNAAYKAAAESSQAEDDGSLFGEQGLSKASKYKIIAGVLAFILFTVIGVAAVRTKSEADAAEDKEKKPADTPDEKSGDGDKGPGI